MEEVFEVGGVRLPRPFKLLRLGHFGVNVSDPEASLDFYTRLLGLQLFRRRARSGRRQA
jgi:catechol-2,3-dioxygenase